MKAEQANAIPMSEIMDKLNFLPVKNSNCLDIWYYSPFREERTPSFHVNAVKNVWYDFGEGKGGKVIDFVCAWLEHSAEDDTVADALRWLDNMTLKPSPLVFFPKQEAAQERVPLVLQNLNPLQHPALINYLDARGIPFILARKYLKEAVVYNDHTSSEFFALALRNEDNGYELRNKFFKGSLAPKHISFVRGTKTSCGEINIFEGWTDFLSALVYQKGNRFEGDTIILNSLSCLSKALPYIETCPYDTLRTWLDNDAAGEKATEAFNKFAIARGDLFFKPMNKTYAPHKDVNAWHMKKLGL